MIARYLTECAICDGSIAPGDEITRDAKGQWVHGRVEDCDVEEIPGTSFVRLPTKPVVICPVCNCTRPCWCPEAIQAPEDAADRALRRAKENAQRDPFDGFL